MTAPIDVLWQKQWADADGAVAPLSSRSTRTEEPLGTIGV
jgi:hypothetical protein